MVSFVIREPTNIEAENFWENSSQQDVTESRFFPQHSLMFRIHSLASGEDTFDWNGMDSVGYQVEFREIEFEHVITHFIMHWKPRPVPYHSP